MRSRHPGAAKILVVAIVCICILAIISSTFVLLRSAKDCPTYGSFVRSSLESFASSSLTTDHQSYTSAIFILKCLTTPGCFPSLNCKSGVPKRIPRKKKWEEQAFCVDDVRKNDCLVYSFGIHTSWEWEAKMAKLFGCQVHAFDPTMNHPKQLDMGVTFHQWGLQAAGTNMSATHSNEYQAIDASRLHPLNDIMQRLGHANRTLDVLMLDCEGCEWGALRQLMCNGRSHIINQIVVEMHFQKNLGLLNEADVLAAAQAVLCMEQARWGIVSIEPSGAGEEDADYARDVTKVLHGSTGAFLLNIALERIPDEDPLPSERLESIASLSKVWDRARTPCFNKYGDKPKDWPPDVCLEYRKLDREYQQAIHRYRSIKKVRANFDEHPRLDESKWKATVD